MRVLLSCLVLATLLACADDDRSAVKAAEKEIFALHDAVMQVTMNTIPKLQTAVQQRIARLDSVALVAGPTTQNLQRDEQRRQAAQLSQQLREADQRMETWMARYNGDTLATLPIPDALNYLDKQKRDISDVKQYVDRTVAATKAFLGQ